MLWHVLEKVDEMRLEERVFRKFAGLAVVEKVLVKGMSAFEVPEVLFSDLALQITPMNELGERDGEILIDVPATWPELALDQVEQRQPRA